MRTLKLERSLTSAARTCTRGRAAAGAASLMAILAGCAGDMPPDGLSPESFRAAPERAPALVPTTDGPRPVIVARPASPTTPIDVSARVGPPDLSGDAAALDAPVLIESKIGDINGHPVWASQIFSAMADRLRAEAEKVAQGKQSRAQWLEETRRLVTERLGGEIDNQLIKDEGLATLTPEMKVQGLAAILGLWRQDQKSRSGGSEVLADRAARENQHQYYQGLDDQVRDFKDRLLINIVVEKIEDSINITSADIRRFYENNPEIFNPPPVAAFSMILIPASDPSAADHARWALEEGAEFADIARSPLNSYRADTAGRMAEVAFTGDFAAADLFSTPHMSAAARTLRPGDWTGPFGDGRGSDVFLRLDAIVTNRVSLYDAQTAIESYLHTSEFQTRLRQRINQMKTRSSLTDEGEMIARLMAFAEAKFLPPPD